MSLAKSLLLYNILAAQAKAKKQKTQQKVESDLRQSYFTDEYASFDSGEQKKRASLLGNDMTNMMGN